MLIPTICRVAILPVTLALTLFSVSLYLPKREEGTTGYLRSGLGEKLPLLSFTFLAGDQWGEGIPLKGADGLCACIRYDTLKGRSGHLLSVMTLSPRSDVHLTVQQGGASVELHQGEELLLRNGAALVISTPHADHHYTYYRETIQEEERSAWHTRLLRWLGRLL